MTQATAPLPCSTLTGAELSQAKEQESRIYTRGIILVASNFLQACGPWPSRVLECIGQCGCYTLLEVVVVLCYLLSHVQIFVTP